MSVRPKSNARVAMSLFAVSALVSISLITDIVLFLSAQPIPGLVALALSIIGFVALFLLLLREIKSESESYSTETQIPVAERLTWDEFSEEHQDFLFSPTGYREQIPSHLPDSI